VLNPEKTEKKYYTEERAERVERADHAPQPMGSLNSGGLGQAAGLPPEGIEPTSNSMRFNVYDDPVRNR